MKYAFYLLSFVLIFGISCSEDEETRSSEEQILSYLEANDLEAEKTSSGLYYIIEAEGTGQRPSASSTVVVGYKGYLTDGTVFDQNGNASFSLTRVIPGWTEGMQLFREGGNGILFVPAELGYGSSGISGVIPGNSALVFEVDLKEVF
ncbi:MAG: FKBP-type peptidyl-prolyl cis-trans isomerase FkpA [Cyclobacteriaceae bacterium]|jgi:FKBP-type peptidyl-prolyl cis-trans isomerase FkpA